MISRIVSPLGVIPANAGIQSSQLSASRSWMPACAGMTSKRLAFCLTPAGSDYWMPACAGMTMVGIVTPHPRTRTLCPKASARVGGPSPAMTRWRGRDRVKDLPERHGGLVSGIGKLAT